MKLNYPTEPGAYPGDEFFGDESNTTRVTHKYINDQWVSVVHPNPGVNETPIPGLDAIPADMPNAEEGEMPLHYDVQTFNALVAANTAQQTEISSLNDKIQMLVTAGDRDRETIANYEESMGDLQAMRKEDRATINGLHEAIAAHATTIRDQQKAIKEQSYIVEHARDHATALSLQLERMKGYLDRTLEQDEQYDKSPAIPEQPILRPRGPRIGDIAIPMTKAERDLFPDGFPGERSRVHTAPMPRNF